MLFGAKKRKSVQVAVAGGALVALALGMAGPVSAVPNGGNFHVKSTYDDRNGYYPKVKYAEPGDPGSNPEQTTPPTTNPGSGNTPTPTPNPTTPTPTTPPPAPELGNMIFSINLAAPGCTTAGRSVIVQGVLTDKVVVTDPTGASKTLNKSTASTEFSTVPTDKTGTWSISGEYERVAFVGNKCLTEVSKWKGATVNSAYQTFKGTTNLTAVAEIPTQITNMQEMFDGASKFNNDVSEWKTSKVTNMNFMFREATVFRGNGIQNFNTGSVTTANDMFKDAKAFNGDLGSWDTSNLTSASSMFWGTANFEGTNLNNWNTSKLTTLRYMFYNSGKFDGDLSNWKVGNVTDMVGVFQKSDAYTGKGIGSWDVGNASTLKDMFSGATKFNGGIGAWAPKLEGKSKSLDNLLSGATAFKQDLSSWKLCSGTTTPSSIVSGSGIAANAALHPVATGLKCTA